MQDVRLLLRIVFIIVSSCTIIVATSVRAQQGLPYHDVFTTSADCIACHSNITGTDGQDYSIGYAWRASMMANSARDPYWHAGVRREVMDHPQAQQAIEDKCSTCHMPMARHAAASAGQAGEVFAHLTGPAASVATQHALDGVSCTVCHQMESDNFGQRASFDGGFIIDTRTPAGQRPIYGPFEIDAGRQRVMQSATGFAPAQSSHIRESELCATCHTLYTHALDEDGNDAGELPEQMPYVEWLHSDYRNTQSCQDCHMPKVEGEVAISSVTGQPRSDVGQHVFRGGNAFMLRILNRYRDELQVAALPEELETAAARTEAHLATRSAVVSIEGAARAGTKLAATVAITNLAGHKLPSAYPSRRAWLHLRVVDAGGDVVFESGALRPDGSIQGNDNDADAARFEPHHAVIDSAEQVQVYEPIMVDARARVTTGLLSGVRYIKDNRLLPEGFDKTTASPDVAVHGAAYDDADFTAAGDRVRYDIRVPAEGPLTITATLLYQSIAYRWAQNLKAYDAFETQRFVRYYEDNAGVSAVPLAADSVEVR